MPQGESVVALDVVRVDGTCLDAVTEYVAVDQVDSRRADLADDSTVVAASVTPLAVAQQSDDRRDQQWALDELGVPEGSSDMPWPHGTGVVVAVIDSGVDASHSDLADAVVGRRHFPGETDLDPADHGTHVAGIIAAREGNGGAVGVAPAAAILDVPVTMTSGLGGAVHNEAAGSWVVGLAWAVNHGARVVNMSISAPLAQWETADALEEYAAALALTEFAVTHDVVLAAAAGNCGGRVLGRALEGCGERHEIKAPAAFPGVVAVGAVDEDLGLAKSSSRNRTVDLVAPGGGILSTSSGGGYAEFTGTSMATPHVAGASAAAIASNPEPRGTDVAQALLDAADRDRLPEDERDDPGVGHGFLDIAGTIEQLAGPDEEPPPEEPSVAERTQVAFEQDGTLYAFDGTSHPVTRSGRYNEVTWVEWSAGHSQLVGADDDTIFSWAGPGTEAVEAPCEQCGPTLAYLDDVVVTDPGEGGRTGDLVVSLAADGTLTRYEAHSLDELGTSPLKFPADAVGSTTLHGDVGGLPLVHESGGAQASERVWLVDPVSGEAQASRDVDGEVQGRIAVPAEGDRVALITGHGGCSDEVAVLDGDDLSELANPDTPPELVVDELFFNGDTLYAIMTRAPVGAGSNCEMSGSAGLWRLEGATWRQVDATPTPHVRPMEGLTGAPATGRLAVSGDRFGFFERTGLAADTTDLGRLDSPLWATPTRTEVDLSLPAPTACEEVVLAPNSDDVLDDVLATGVPCEVAEALLRTIAERTGPVTGEPELEAEGYTCTRTAQTADPLPSADYRCARGTAVITFTRT